MSEKIRNSTENMNNLDITEKNKKSTYNAKNQADYRKKVKQYNVKYSLADSDLEKVRLIDKAIEQSGMSANAWIKIAIDEKLERDGFL